MKAAKPVLPLPVGEYTMKVSFAFQSRRNMFSARSCAKFGVIVSSIVQLLC